MSNNTFTEGELVVQKWGGGRNKPFFLVLNPNYVHPFSVKAGGQPSKDWNGSVLTYNHWDNRNLLATKVLNGTGTYCSRQREVDFKSDDFTLATAYLENKIVDLETELKNVKTILETVKTFENDQKLFLLQGGYGNHRVRRRNVQARKGSSIGTRI